MGVRTLSLLDENALRASARAEAAAGPGRLLEVLHDTHYAYGAQVDYAQHLARLRPRVMARQQLIESQLSVQPAPLRMTVDADVFGNTRVFFALEEPHDALHVRAHSMVKVQPLDFGAPFGVHEPPPPVVAPADWSLTAWEAVRERLAYRAGAPFDAASEFTFASFYAPRTRELADYAARSFVPGRALVQAAWDLMHRIHEDFVYDQESTEVSTVAPQALAIRRGVCQDFAHVMIAGMRSLGLAARYVSGYLLTATQRGKPRLVGADASHAWVSVYDPAWPHDGGWFDLDPTNDRIPGTDYVTVAWGRDYADVAPLRGVIRGGGEHELEVAVTVTPRGALPAIA